MHGVFFQGVAAVLSAPTAFSGANSAGTVFVSPSPMDASRDTVANSNMPGTENGAFVLQNAGGIVGDHRDQPLLGSMHSTSSNDTATAAPTTHNDITLLMAAPSRLQGSDTAVVSLVCETIQPIWNETLARLTILT